MTAEPSRHLHVRRALIRGAALAGASVLALGGAAAQPAPGDWPSINHDPGALRFSPLKQITPANVKDLKVAWVYHMKPAATEAVQSAAEREQAAAEGAAPPPGAPAGGPPGGQGGGPFARSPQGYLPSEAMPLVVEGVMYLSTPYNRLVALDPNTGKEIWAYTTPNRDQIAQRGIEYWPGDKTTGASIVFGTRDGKLISVQAKTGKPTAGFGDNGVVNLKTADVMVTGLNRGYGMNSPPVIYKNLIITGSNTGEGMGGPVGDIRAWDAHTGKQVWSFASRPPKGDPNHGTWGNDSDVNRSGVNVWGLMSVDVQRGIVFLPFGAPANDRIGTDRPGNNLYSSSIVAVNAATGKYLWHFQITHHDIWDVDSESPPTLFDVKRGGKTIPAVGLASKAGLMFILDRTNGKPIYGVEERPVPQSDVPGEQTSPTQPFPIKPEPLARNTMTKADLSKVTPEQEAWCKKFVEDNNILLGGPYLPTAFNRPTVNFPGTIGGVNWSGGSVDPTLGYYIVNVLNLGQVQQIVRDPTSGIGFANRSPIAGRFWNNADRLPCNAPPWGQLVAVNVNTGDIAWRSTLGVTDSLPAGLQNTGRPSLGGPISTAGGLTFIAATDDARFRAFESRTGKEVWTVKLPGAAHTNPVTYGGAGGKQYVAIVATGGAGFLGTPITGDSLVVYSLP